MNVSSLVSALAWVSSIMLAWFVAVDQVQYSGFVLGVWIFFIIVGLGAGLMSFTTGARRE